MYARAFFSHKQLMNKSCTDIHEMLYTIGKNWATDLTNPEKNGTFIIRNEFGIIHVRQDILPYYEDISRFIEDLVEYQD